MLRNFFFLVVTIFLSSSIIFGSNLTVQGDVTTTIWDVDTVFVVGDLTINTNEVLTIKAGTKIIINGDYKISISGLLNANGSENDSIRFYSENTNWKGIFLSTNPINEKDSSNFSYCSFQNVSGMVITSAISCYNYNYVKIVNCSFVDNYNENNGGAILIKNCNVDVLSNEFYNNESYNGGAIFCSDDAVVRIFSNKFKNNNVRGSGGAIYNTNSAKVIIKNNIFFRNIANLSGGAIFNRDYEVYIINNIFFDNEGVNAGGGAIYNSSGTLVQGNLIVKNSALWGGGISDSGTDIRYSNNTIVHNHAQKGGGIHLISESYHNSLVTNSILYFNTANEGDQVFFDWKALTPFNYNNIEGGKDGFTYKNQDVAIGDDLYIKNIDFNPKFNNPILNDTIDFNSTLDNWSLQSNSLLINGGRKENFDSTFGVFDIAGNSRVYGKNIDIGMSEFQNTPDAIPQLSVVKSKFDFGIQNLNTYSNTKFLILENLGHSPLNILNISLPTDFYIISSSNEYLSTLTNINIDSKSDTSFQIVFHPKTSKKYIDSLLIVSNSQTNSQQYVKVEGDGKKISYLSGTINSSLTINDYIIIEDDLFITTGSILTIQPGAVLNIYEGKRIDVKGRIIAEGTEKDSIVFTSFDTTGFYVNPNEITGSWEGIFFDNSDGLLSGNDSSKFKFCKIEYCKYNPNAGVIYGGAIKIIKFSEVLISNSLLQHNYFNSYSAAGGAVFADNCSPKIEENTFYKNYANLRGGAIFCDSENCEPLLYKNIFIKNKSRYGAAIYANSYTSPTIISNRIEDNTATNDGGGIFIENHSTAIIESNHILQNLAYRDGGGIASNSRECLIIKNIISNNKAYSDGGGISLKLQYSDMENKLIISGNIIANNSAKEGGALGLMSPSILVGNTIVNNNARIKAAISSSPAMYNPDIYNCIIWGNDSEFGDDFTIETDKIYSNLMFEWDEQEISEIKKMHNNFNNNIINIDPRFIHPTIGAGIDYDASKATWSLKDSSLAIDCGVNSIDSIKLDSLDIYDNTRIFNKRIDIGAIEMQIIQPSFVYLENMVDTLDFYGATVRDSSKIFDLIINNYGSEDALIEEVVFPLGFWGKLSSNATIDTVLKLFTLSAKTDTVINIIFKPTATDTYGGFLEINCSKNANDNTNTYLKGFGTSAKFVKGIISSNSLWSDSIRVMGNIVVNSNVTLTVAPGTKVVFEDEYSINVLGNIKCIGTENDSISFSLLNKKVNGYSGWNGIDLSKTSVVQDSSIFRYTYFSNVYDERNSCLNIERNSVLVDNCRFENNFSLYNASSINIKDSETTISNSTFIANRTDNNGGAIKGIADSSTIYNCTFIENTARYSGGAIWFQGGAKITKCYFNKNIARDGAAINIFGGNNVTILKNNIFTNNYSKDEGGAIFLLWSEIHIINNIIVNNSSRYKGGGISMNINSSQINSSSGIVILNNTIANNSAGFSGGGLFIERSKNQGIVNFYNNIFTGNIASDSLNQFYFTDDFPFHFYNCNIENFTTLGYDSTKFTDIIDVDSHFINPTDSVGYLVNASATDWRLQDHSFCINQGTESLFNFSLPIYDIDGNNRVFSRIDIGAYENQTVVSVAKTNIPIKFVLNQNYPNPFNPSTTISYSIPKSGFVKIRVFDILGRNVANVVNEYHKAGNYNTKFDANNLTSGIYFYTIKSGNFSDTKKMILLR